MDENLPQDNQPKESREPNDKFGKLKLLLFVLGAGLLIYLGYFFFISPPGNFAPGTTLEIRPGMSLHSISGELKEENIIRSRIAFEAFVILFGGEKHIRFSNYLFESEMSSYEVAKWIVKGDRYRAPIVVTIPEGFNTSEMTDLFATKLIKFDRANFLAQAKPKEGYLFPDTYYFFSNDTETNAITAMSKNFEKKIAPIRGEIDASGKTEDQIITMASVLEREAKGDADRAIISGILWKRISNGMPLQVDAAPETYKIKGLPKNPISNPGLEAIHAAIYPESSPYLYYLHGTDGETHYAKTFAEHKKNKAKYLK